MFKQNLIHVLWLFLAIVTFFSCGDAVGPSINGIKFRLDSTPLAFTKFTGSKYDGHGEMLWIQECNIGDTIALGCSFWVSDYDYYYNKGSIPETITVKISTLYGSGRATLIKRGIFGSIYDIPIFYSAYLVPIANRNGWKYPAGMVTLQQYNYWIHELETWETPYGTFPVSLDGDILTAEITYKNKIIKTSLTIIGETK
jgi:hypothetical protein